MAKKKTNIKYINNTNRVDLSSARLRYPLPNLIESQLNSYQKFLEKDLVEHFSLINPITDATGKLWSLEFLKPTLKESERAQVTCLRKGLTYEAPLYWQVRLVNKQTGEAKEQEVFMGNIPLMTERGTFIIGGIERCIVHQVIRAEGVIFLANGLYYNNLPLHMAKMIPARGAWFTIDTSKTGIISIKLGPKRAKMNICTFLRAMGYSSNAEILNLFKDIKLPDENAANFIETTLAKDPTDSTAAAVFDIYRRLRPDVTASLDNAKSYIDSLIFDSKRLFLGDVGRYQLNKKLDPKYSKEMSEENYKVFVSDIIGVIEKLININLGVSAMDDIDHLGNRRLRGVNELLGESVADAVRKIEKNTKDKMTLHSPDELLTASDIMSSRPLITALKDFFGSSQVSRYMNQKNVLAEISNIRNITATGPNGITAERATFSVRDVHYSQYGRFCVVETPDGPQIGISNHLALFARINDYGFIEVPYRKLERIVKVKDALNRVAIEDITAGDKVIVKAQTLIDEKVQAALEKAKVETIEVYPFVTDEIVYMDADEESRHRMILTEVKLDDNLNIVQDSIPVRYNGDFYTGSIKEVEFIDISPEVTAGVNFALMPFGNHTEVGRTLIEASNMKQAVPLFDAEPPLVGTGREVEVAKLSGRAIYAKNEGTVEYADAQKIVVKTKKGKDEYFLTNFVGSNDNTLIHHTTKVSPGMQVEEGQLLADGSSIVNGEVSIGTNIMCACMFFDGKTFEDGFVISERILKNGKLNGIIITTHTRDIRDTKLGPEQLTNDIPGVSESMLGSLGEDGVIRKGAKVKAGDILAGIISPKGEMEVSAEEKLLRAIFGESAHDVKDVSLRMPHGEEGIVVDTQILDRTTEELSTGVLKQVKVWIGKQHSINIGDKLCDLAGQKGVISKIVPEEDMPYMEDGTPIDLIFTPLFLKRMNVSLLREMSLGMKAKLAGVDVAVPLFSATDESILDEMIAANGKVHQEKYNLVDGRNGEELDNKVAVGSKYILKIEHLAQDKIHARSTGPYTIVTQQPLGGKAQFGGQRFGEMEVWALEAHGAANILQEMLTIKSDDIPGRSKAYESIIHGEKFKMEGTPESFNVFINEIKALGLNVKIKQDNGEDFEIDNTQKEL